MDPPLSSSHACLHTAFIASPYHACSTRQSIVPLAHWVSYPSSLTEVRDKVASWFRALTPGHALVGLVFGRGVHVVLVCSACSWDVLQAPLGHAPYILAYLGMESVGEGRGQWSSVFAAVTSLGL